MVRRKVDKKRAKYTLRQLERTLDTSDESVECVRVRRAFSFKILHNYGIVTVTGLLLNLTDNAIQLAPEDVFQQL